MSLLKGDQKLVYYDNYSHLAELLPDGNYNLLTDNIGNRYNTPALVTLSPTNIITVKPDSSTSQTFTYLGEGIFNFTGFVKGLVDKSTKTGLGAGLYGLYTDKPDLGITVTITKPLILHDEMDGRMLTVASVETNRYVDKVVLKIQTGDFETINQVVKETSTKAIKLLWNSFLYRREKKINSKKLKEILISYIDHYFNDTQIHNFSNDVIHQTPINFILHNLDYNGIYATDDFNNGWCRGCVAYYPEVNSPWPSVYSESVEPYDITMTK